MSQFLLTFRTKYLITVSSVGITKMLMGGPVFASEASEKKFFRPLLGGPEKVDCLV